jgi:hypothetical protein
VIFGGEEMFGLFEKKHRCETCGLEKPDKKFSWPTARECKACYMRKRRAVRKAGKKR